MDTIVYLSYKRKAISSEEESTVPWNYDIAEHIRMDYRILKVCITQWEEQATVLPNLRPRQIVARMRRKRMDKKRLQRKQAAEQRTKDAFLQDLAALLQEWDEKLICYDTSVPRECWVRDILPLEEFQEATEQKWVVRLLESCEGHYFIVLGEVSCTEQILWSLAPRMKSLLWIVAGQEREEHLEEFAEEFYLDTGLAVQLQILWEDRDYGRYRMPGNFGREAVTVLDFLEGNRVPDFRLPAGSVWLDMTSNADKERRIAARGWTCEVISLRKQWKNL